MGNISPVAKSRVPFDAWAWIEEVVLALWSDGFRTKGKIVAALEIISRTKDIIGVEMFEELIKIAAAETPEKELSRKKLRQWLFEWGNRYSLYQKETLERSIS